MIETTMTIGPRLIERKISPRLAALYRRKAQLCGDVEAINRFYPSNPDKQMERLELSRELIKIDREIDELYDAAR